MHVQLEINHDAAGLAELCRRLRSAGVTTVAIERPSGLIVDALLEAGFSVVPIHPNVVKATRPRYRSHGGKSDASATPTCWPICCAPTAIASSRWPRKATTSGRCAHWCAGATISWPPACSLANQLRSLLQSFWPGAAEVFADVDSPIALAFIQRYPTPESASRLGPKRMAAFCAQHAYSGRRSPEELLHSAASSPSRRAWRVGNGGQGRTGSQPGAHAGSPGRTAPAADQPHRAPRRLDRRRPHPDELPARRTHLRSADPGRAGQRARALRQRRAPRRRGRRRTRDLSHRASPGP